MLKKWILLYYWLILRIKYLELIKLLNNIELKLINKRLIIKKELKNYYYELKNIQKLLNLKKLC